MQPKTPMRKAEPGQIRTPLSEQASEKARKRWRLGKMSAKLAASSSKAQESSDPFEALKQSSQVLVIPDDTPLQPLGGPAVEPDKH